MIDHDPSARVYTVPCTFVTGDAATTFQRISADLKERYSLSIPAETLAAHNASLTAITPCQPISIPLPDTTPPAAPTAESDGPGEGGMVEQIILDLSSYPAFVKSYRKVFFTDPTPETFDLMRRMQGASPATDAAPSAPSPAVSPSDAGRAQTLPALPDDLGYPEGCACST